MNTTTTQSLVTFLHLLLHELQPTVLIVLDPRPTSVHPLCADLIEAAFTASRPAQVLGYRCEDRRYLANPRDSHWTQHGSADQRLAARLRIRLPFASVRTARVLCVHVCTDPDAAADDDQRTNRGGRSFYDATVSLLANRIGLPVHAMQHVVLAGRHSMAADANDGPAFRSVLQATTPLALLVECRSPTVHQRGVRVHSVVRADDFARVWSADEFAAALRRMAPVWRLNQRQPDVGHPMVVRLQSDLIACDPQSADRRRLAAIEQRWRMHAVSPFGARPPDGVAVGLYVLDRRHYGDEPPWLRRGYQMVVPNWWHWQPARRPTSRQLADDAVALVGVSHAAASTGVAFLALFALRWVLVQHRRHGIVERTAASTSAAGRFAWLLLDQWARSLGTSAPTARGETTLLAAGVALGCSGWGMWNAATLTGLSYRNSLADDDQLQWRPVFETLDDLRTHGGVLKVVSNEEGLQVAAQRWTKEIELVTAGRSEEVSFRDEVFFPFSVQGGPVIVIFRKIVFCCLTQTIRCSDSF